MYLKSIRIRSLKRFRDSGDITFSPGINVVVGANDVGKTTLIDAISGRVASAPHRSPETARNRDAPGEPSSVDLTIHFSGVDAREVLSRRPTLVAPVESGHEGELTSALRRFSLGGGDLLVNRNGGPAHLSTLPAWNVNSWTNLNVAVQENGDLTFGQFGVTYTGNVGENYVSTLVNYFSNRLYAFSAERFGTSKTGFGSSPTLSTDARNLPEPLHHLQSNNPAKHSRFVSYVSAVFPHITDVRTVPLGNNEIAIKVWDTHPQLERDDLAVDLSQSGTGIGQVLAMLYVVVTSTTESIIIIDEPHSFLHPGALRRLFEILSQEYPQHQYIITTNSPTAILSAAPASVVLINRRGHESVASSTTIDSSSNLALFLDTVGAHLSDVFGADAIVWVEGRTEEKCIQQLVKHFAAKESRGLLVREFVATSDLGRKDAEKVFSIYHRLSGGATLLPPALAFLFDREDRTDEEIKRIRAASGGLAHFLRRKMYENYLLVPSAISRLLKEHDRDNASAYTEETVSAWILKNGAEARFHAASGAVTGSDEWRQSVDAAKLLYALCSELTDARVCYDKVRDGQMLTHYLLESEDQQIREFVDQELMPVLARRSSKDPV